MSIKTLDASSYGLFLDSLETTRFLNNPVEINQHIGVFATHKNQVKCPDCDTFLLLSEDEFQSCDECENIFCQKCSNFKRVFFNSRDGYFCRHSFCIHSSEHDVICNTCWLSKEYEQKTKPATSTHFPYDSNDYFFKN